MKRSRALNVLAVLVLVISGFASCKKTEDPIKFKYGTFPDSAVSLTNINSEYDDYNVNLYQLNGEIYILFSSNRSSNGGQFDLEQGRFAFTFDQTTGAFQYLNSVSSLGYLEKLKEAANTDGDDFGPYSLFSTADGYEYLFTASENSAGNLDFYYFMNLPVFGTSLPNVQGPFPATLLNSSSDDAYISFDLNQDSAYFSSDIDGDFDIYVKTRPAGTTINTWLSGSYSASSPADSINSDGDDKCPVIYKDIMVFASNRAGGLGNFDLYYSVFRKGKWSSPVNFGPGINTSSNEFRPRLWIHSDFTNDLLIFSSDRPGGKGRYDLYFAGYTFPEE